jgi:hypothetical protein
MKKLAEVLLGGRKTKEFKVGESVVLLQSLTAQDQSEINSEASGLNALTYLESSKVPTLARSLVEIDKVPIEAFPEVREYLRKDTELKTVQAVEKSLYDMDKENVNLLFSLYLDLETERQAEREKLKNSSRVQSAESSGKSAPVSEKAPVA